LIVFPLYLNGSPWLDSEPSQLHNGASKLQVEPSQYEEASPWCSNEASRFYNAVSLRRREAPRSFKEPLDDSNTAS